MKTTTKLEGLRPRRIALGLTQQQLADALSLERSNVAVWERGQGLPSAALLPKLASVLCCTIDELFVPDSGAEAATPPEEGGESCAL